MNTHGISRRQLARLDLGAIAGVGSFPGVGNLPLAHGGRLQLQNRRSLRKRSLRLLSAAPIPS
jgi:hypothetical protein